MNGPLSTGGALGATPEGSVDLRSSAQLRPATISSRFGLAGLIGVVATAVLVCVAAPSTLDLLPESASALYPGAHLAGLFGVTGLRLHAGELMALLALMFAAYVIAVRNAENLSPRAVLTAVLAFIAIVSVAPPLFSTDVFSYQAYARMFVEYGSNPYTHGPSVLYLPSGFSDSVYSYIGAKWYNTPSVYGPLFTLFSGLFAKVGVATSAFAFKWIAAACCMLTVWLLWQTSRLRGLNPVRSVALFGLNPLVILYGIGGGHNDMLMVALTTAGIYFLLSHRERAGGATIALGAAIKLTGGLMFPFALASGTGLGGGSRRKAVLIGAVIASIVVAAIGFGVFGTGLLRMPFTLDRVQGEGAWQSVPGFITTVLRLKELGHVVGLLLGVTFIAITARLLWRVWKGQLDWLDGLAWSTFTILLTTSSLLPWYVTWLIPPVALCTTRKLWNVTLWFTGWVLFTTALAYVPHGVAFLGI